MLIRTHSFHKSPTCIGSSPSYIHELKAQKLAKDSHKQSFQFYLR
ncbi:hypothetical protein BN1088_1440002 [Sphingobacterium sp. PM2-P1-29]|nr:hypothetical protein BN1088_1440002 [Sphingobacterium sp. PM2-P1-29]